MRIIRLALFLLLTHVALALPTATSDAREIARGLPQSCALVATAQMTPDQLISAVGHRNLELLATRSGLTLSQLSDSADGRAFLAVYDGNVVTALGLKSPLQPKEQGRGEDGWLLFGEPALLDDFLAQPLTLAVSSPFQKVTDHWPGGSLLLYSGDLLKPPKSLLEGLAEEVDIAQYVQQLVSQVPACPHLCAGMSGDLLEAWVAPLAPKVKAGETWSTTFRGGILHRQSPADFPDGQSEIEALIDEFRGLNVSLPLEWKLYIAAVLGLRDSEALSLPATLLPIVNAPAPQGSNYEETLQAQGDGMWVYRLDAGQTAELGRSLKQGVDGLLSDRLAVRKTTPEQECGSNLKNIATALEMHWSDHENYPSTLQALTPDYLKTIPACPVSGSSEGYEKSFKLSGASFEVFCSGSHHKIPNHPRYVNGDFEP